MNGGIVYDALYNCLISISFCHSSFFFSLISFQFRFKEIFQLDTVKKPPFNLIDLVRTTCIYTYVHEVKRTTKMIQTHAKQFFGVT